MESRRDSTLCSPRVAADEDQDFLSRYVNLGWDADSSEWNYRDDFPDILSSEYDLLKLFSREHSFEKVHDDVKNSRKSSLEKPVGFLMQLKPCAYVCESLKSSCWGKFLSSEKRVCDSKQSYLNHKANIERTEVRNSGKERQSFASGRRRSKSVNDVLQESNCESVLDQKQEENQSLKQESKNQNASCGIKRATNRIQKQFSVYSQNFALNTRFLSKSHYHISHWRPENSRVTRKANQINRKEPNVMMEEQLAFKRNDHEKETEIEEVRRKFNTDKKYKSWVWEPENSPSSKHKICEKGNQKQQNSSTKPLKMCGSTEFANKKIISKKNLKERSKISGPTRQLSQGVTASSTFSLPALSSHNNTCSVSRQKSPHKLGHFPCISTDNLMKQYKKYHDEFIKQKNKNINENKK